MSYGQNLRRWGARALFTVALLGGTIAIAPATAAHATPGTYKSVEGAEAWVDFNGDGRADHCIIRSSAVQCALSNGSGLGTPITLTNVDTGDVGGRAWVDFNGDGRADFCRVVGGGHKYLSCTLSNGTSWGATYTSGSVDQGWPAGKAWVDFNGDGRADYCRVIGSGSQKIQCTLSTGTGFGATYTSVSLDAGWNAGRGWTDVNGDGRADYCRAVGGDRLQCTLSGGTGFGATFTSTAVPDLGWDDSRVWADFNGDGRADYCRVIGNFTRKLRCTVSTGGNNFGATYTSAALDPGYTATADWVDFNGDGRADYCRQNGGFSGCTISTDTGFGATYSYKLGHKLATYVKHGWADINGDGLIDHGLIVDQTYIAHNLHGNGWSSVITSPSPLR